MPFDIVTIGVVCADVMVYPIERWPRPGELALVPNIDARMGGLASVTASVASQLGARTAFIGRLGNDLFGNFLNDELRRHNVETPMVRWDETEGTSATIVTIDKSGERSFMHRVGATKNVTPADVDLGLLRGTKIFHWGGPAITPGLQGGPIGELFERVRAQGIATSIDTCFDGAGVWYPHIEHALPHTTIMMSSVEEARHYTGRQTDDEIADFYLGHGAETVLVKLGEEGVLAADRAERHRIPAHRVNVLDTTGAGDAACGGFLYAYVKGWSLRDSAALANAVGGLTVQAHGGAEAGVTLARARQLAGLP